MPAPAEAQTIPENDVINALAGVFSGIHRAEAGYGENTGFNLDKSLRWEYREDSESLRIAFDNFRYYVAEGTAGEKRVVTMEGALNMETGSGRELLSGSVAVGGIPRISTLEFAGYGSNDTGTFRVNGRAYDGETAENLIEEAAERIDDDLVISAELESLIVFYLSIMALNDGDLEERLSAEAMEEDRTSFRPGVTVSNSQGTLKIVTQRNALELLFDTYMPEQVPIESVTPFFDGTLVMTYNTENENLILDGSLRIKNMPFVSTMNFDSCRMPDSARSAEDITGTITINGTGYPYGDFVTGIRQGFAL
jgi:hypothetical protein